MVMFTIYRPITTDHPGKWVVRKWYTFPGMNEPVADPDPALADGLEEARGLVPPGCVRLERHETDDDVIEEVWI